MSLGGGNAMIARKLARLITGTAVIALGLGAGIAGSASASPRPPGGSDVRSFTQALNSGHECTDPAASAPGAGDGCPTAPDCRYSPDQPCKPAPWRLVRDAARWQATVVYDLSNSSRPFLKANVKLSTLENSNQWQEYHGTTRVELVQCQTRGQEKLLARTDWKTIPGPENEYTRASPAYEGRYQFPDTLQETDPVPGVFPKSAKFKVRVWVMNDAYVRGPGPSKQALLLLGPLGNYESKYEPAWFRTSTTCMTPR